VGYNAMRMKSRYVGGLALAATLWTASIGAAEDPIQQALNQGDARTAYTLAERRLANEIGDPDFDMLYGLAAINSGRAEEAVFAFERVLLTRPRDARARLELARAHFTLGDYDTAQQGFEAVQQQNPPPNVQQWITRYLSAIKQRQAHRERHWQLLAGLGMGHDTNVNSAPGIDSYSTDLITLSPDDAEADQFAELNTAAIYTHALSKTRSWCAGIAASAHNNLDTDTYDTLAATINGCYGWGGATRRWKFSALSQWLTLDSERFRDLYAISLELTQPVWTRLQSSSNIQLGITRYPDQTTRDVNFITFNSGLLWPIRPQHALNTSLNLGYESATEDEGEANARTYGGLQAQWLWQLTPRGRLVSQVNYQYARYGDEYALENTVRQDNTFTLGPQFQYQLGNRWLAGTEYRYTKASSNIDLFDYARNVVQLTLRYQTD
jgi:outer membrane protein